MDIASNTNSLNVIKKKLNEEFINIKNEKNNLIKNNKPINDESANDADITIDNINQYAELQEKLKGELKKSKHDENDKENEIISQIEKITNTTKILSQNKKNILETKKTIETETDVNLKETNLTKLNDYENEEHRVYTQLMEIVMEKIKNHKLLVELYETDIKIYTDIDKNIKEEIQKYVKINNFITKNIANIGTIAHENIKKIRFFEEFIINKKKRLNINDKQINKIKLEITNIEKSKEAQKSNSTISIEFDEQIKRFTEILKIHEEFEKKINDIIKECETKIVLINNINSTYDKRNTTSSKKTSEYNELIKKKELELKQHEEDKNKCYFKIKKHLDDNKNQQNTAIKNIENEIKFYNERKIYVEKNGNSQNEIDKIVGFIENEEKELSNYKNEIKQTKTKLLEINNILEKISKTDKTIKQLLDSVTVKKIKTKKNEISYDSVIIKQDDYDKIKDNSEKINILKQLIFVKQIINSFLEYNNVKDELIKKINNVLIICKQIIENIKYVKEIEFTPFQQQKINKSIIKIEHGLIYILSNNELLNIFTNNDEYLYFKNNYENILNDINQDNTKFKNLKIIIEMIEQSFQTIYSLFENSLCEKSTNEKCYLDLNLQLKNKYLKYKTKYINYKMQNDNVV